MEFETCCADVKIVKLSQRNKYSSTITLVIRVNRGIESLEAACIEN
jgi:hypothetical protein